MKNSTDWQYAHEFITGTMDKIKRPAAGMLKYPYLSITCGSAYAESIFSWDNHHMTLRYAAGGEFEQMLYFLKNMFQHQSTNGFTPCVNTMANGPCLMPYFHAQPFLAQNAAVYLQETGDLKEVAELYPKMVKYLDHWLTAFKAPFGLYRWGETYMSGFDNEISGTILPPGAAVPPDLSSLLYLELRAMAFIAGRMDLADEAAKYLEESEELKENINRYLWDEEYGVYAVLDLTSGKLMTHYHECNRQSDFGVFSYISCPALLPLFAGIAPADRARRMIEEYVLSPAHFRSDYGIRSLSKSSEYYNNAIWGNPGRFSDYRRVTNSNWQGPVWIPLNWFVFHALVRYGYGDDAAKLAEDSVGVVARNARKYGYMAENFDGDTGENLYAKNFASWNILADIMVDFLNPESAPFKMFF